MFLSNVWFCTIVINPDIELLKYLEKLKDVWLPYKYKNYYYINILTYNVLQA